MCGQKQAPGYTGWSLGPHSRLEQVLQPKSCFPRAVFLFLYLCYKIRCTFYCTFSLLEHQKPGDRSFSLSSIEKKRASQTQKAFFSLPVGRETMLLHFYDVAGALLRDHSHELLFCSHKNLSQSSVSFSLLFQVGQVLIDTFNPFM